MAKILKADKPFLLIECTAEEMSRATGSAVCVCDSCGVPCLPEDEGVYIAVLNSWYCKRCFEDWVKRAHYYAQDAIYERRHFDCYAPLLGVKCQ